MSTRNYIAAAIGACLALSLVYCTKARAQAVGVHAYTWHDAGRLESSTPGLYVRLGGLTAGVYSNSYHDTSTYAGWTWSRPHALGDYSLTAGAVTGYPAGVLPLVVPSVRFGFVRVSALARVVKAQEAAGLHFSIEFVK